MLDYLDLSGDAKSAILHDTLNEIRRMVKS